MSTEAEIERALQRTASTIKETHMRLDAQHAALRGTLAISGCFLGHGLGVLIDNGFTDDQIIEHVLKICSQIRDAISTSIS